jgi:hypothetical protein
MEEFDFKPTEKIESDILIISAIALENSEIRDTEILTHTYPYDSDGVSLPSDPLQLNPEE